MNPHPLLASPDTTTHIIYTISGMHMDTYIKINRKKKIDDREIDKQAERQTD